MVASHKPDFSRCPSCRAELEIVSRERFLADNHLTAIEVDDGGILLGAEWGLSRPNWDSSSTLHYCCAGCDAILPETYQAEIDRVLENQREGAPPRFRFLFDVYLHIEADTKAQADQRRSFIEQVVDAMTGCSLVTFDAYGIEDAATGEEIRPVG
jgi:hypothetical protein